MQTTTPSTALKSQSVAADGSITNTYHPPATGSTTPASTNTVVNTPSSTNPTSNPNYNYNAGVTPIAPPAGTPIAPPAQNTGLLGTTPSPGNTVQPLSTSPATGLSSAISGLLNSGQTVPQAVLDAQAAEVATGQNISNLRSTAAGLENSYNTSGQTMPVSQGLSQNVASTEAQQEQGLQQQLATEQTAAGQAQTQQVNQAGILNQAGGLSQPVSQYGALTNPATGQPISSTGLIGGAQSLPPAAQSALALLPQTGQQAIMQQAQMLQNNTTSLASAQNALSAYGQNGLNALNAILGPNFNYNTQTGIAAGQQAVGAAGGTTAAQNIVTSGTANTAAQANLINTQTQNIGAMSAVRDSVAGLSNQLISYLGQNNSLNPSNINAINAVAQTIAANTSNPQYKTLQNLMTDIAGKYANILVPGGASTDYTQGLSQGMLNQLAQGSTIPQVIQGLDAQAQATIGGAQQALTATQTGANPNPSTSLINSAGGANPLGI